MNEGWIGTWTPGIGDPTPGGWLTVFLYGLTAVTVWRLTRRVPMGSTRHERHERWFWKLLFILLVALGLNKQLDLQSAFTEVGRILAVQQDWYADRHQVQEAFIAGIAVLGVTAMAATLYLVLKAPAPTLWAVVGAASLLAFVLARAASFHHIDQSLGTEVVGLRLNWLLEAGGLLVILTSAAWRQRGLR